MNKGKVIALVAIALVFVTGMVLLFSGSKDKDITQTYVSNRWIKTYDLNDNGPYGLRFMEELMIKSGRFSAFDVYTSHKQIDSLKNNLETSIMFVGERSYLTYADINVLLDVVNKGNQLFLVLEEFPYFLLDEILYNASARFIASDSVTVDIEGQQLQQYYIYNTDTLTYFWNVFEKKVPLNQPEIEVNSEIQGYANFISIPYGAGKITLHLNPMFFVNFQLQRKEGFRHFKKAMNFIDYDEIHYLDFAKESFEDVDATDQLGSMDHSILSEVFKYNSLKWSFIFFIIGAILFFLFRAKRRQDPIPVFSEKTNDGIGFADTIAGIYYGKNRPHYLLKLMRRNFYEHIKETFYVDLNNRKSNKSIELLSKKSGYTEKKINYLLTQLDNKDKSITNEGIFDLDKKLREFYILSGVWSDDKLRKIERNYSNVYRIKMTSYGYIIAGILTIVFGFVALSYARGFGALLWPLGMFFIYIGSKALNTPILRMNKRYVEILPLIGKLKRQERENIKSIYVDKNYLCFESNEGELMKLNLSAVSIKERMQLTNLETKKE
jgi:hypothetical protein